jgi:hypothetical protein
MISQKEKNIVLFLMIGLSIVMIVSSIGVSLQCKDKGLCMRNEYLQESTDVTDRLSLICHSLLLLTFMFIAAFIAFSMFFYTEKGQSFMQKMYSEEVQRVRFRTVYPVMFFMLLIHIVSRYYLMAHLC